MRGIFTHIMVDFYGKCRYMNTSPWIVWGIFSSFSPRKNRSFPPSTRRVGSQRARPSPEARRWCNANRAVRCHSTPAVPKTEKKTGRRLFHETFTGGLPSGKLTWKMENGPGLKMYSLWKWWFSNCHVSSLAGNRDPKIMVYEEIPI